MNKEITIYELLKLIKENKAPEKIKANEFRYNIYYKDGKLDYKNDAQEYLSDFIKNMLEYNYLEDMLSVKIGTIEENKEIEKLKIKDDRIIGKWGNGSDYCYTLSAPQTVLTNKINELIDVLNELKKEE